MVVSSIYKKIKPSDNQKQRGLVEAKTKQAWSQTRHNGEIN